MTRTSRADTYLIIGFRNVYGTMTRSALAERWLAYGASRAAERAIEDATAAYYASLIPAERDESEAIARATSRATRRVRFDDPVRKPARRVPGKRAR